MGTAWRHPVHDAGPHGAGWRIHPWLGEPMSWVPCWTCGARGRVFRKQDGQWTEITCMDCEGTRVHLRKAQ